MLDIKQFTMHNSGQPQRLYTVTRSTTFLVVKREAVAQGLVTDAPDPTVVVQTAVVTHMSGTSSFTYEEHFSTATPDAGQSGGPSSNFIIALSVAVPTVLILLIALLMWGFRRRRAKHAADREKNPSTASNSPSAKSIGKLSSNSGWRPGAPSPRSNPPPPNPPRHRLSIVQEHRTGFTPPASPERLPARTDTGTPIAELPTPISPLTVSKNLSTIFQTRRAMRPALPRLQINSANNQHSIAQMPFSPDLVSALTPVVLTTVDRLNHARSSSCGAVYTPSEPTRIASVSSQSNQSQFSPPRLGPDLSVQTTATCLSGLGPGPNFLSSASTGPNNASYSASEATEPPAPRRPTAFPYGYQSEYPEVAGPPPTLVTSANRQREMWLLAEEERLVKERVKATQELIRLKNEEARILDRKRQLGIGR
ncbi:hypothetical protein FN846DRAFT_888530 [Sphaerosporella brunnea]|uniref:Transmembrane protein n=1 Tax=Sphaerosporella brunnea TaxID=1250544 RepID=A0A5J5F2A9_9PEZI|nr:hypothetical protein FN846DRAFT_888530 [Sphaerosporella brunnea]